MASGRIKGITIDIGGDTTKLGKALSDSESKSKSLAGELKEVNRMLKFDSGNVELLAQKQKILTDQIDATSDKLKLLKDAQAQVEAQFQSGDIGADQYRAFQRELMQTESKLDSFKSALEQTTNELSSVGADTSQASSAFNNLSDTINKQESELSSLKDEYKNVVLEQGKNSTEAQELASRISELNGELNQNKSKLNEVDREADELTRSLDSVGDSAKQSGDGFTVMKGAIADLASNAIQGAIGAVQDFVGSLFELSEATEEYRTMQAKLAGSADQFGYSMDFASEKYKQLYSYVDDEQMATNAITNLMGMGLATDEVSRLTDGAIATWTAYGDSIPIESLTESMAESIKVGKVTGTLADTINWVSLSNEQYNSILGEGSTAQKAFNEAIANGEAVEDAFSSALASTSSEQERANLVANLLNTTYGQSKQTYDEVAGSIIDANQAQAELTEAQAQLGEAIEPVNTAFTNFKAQALEAITPLVQQLAQGFQDLMTWLQQHPVVMQVLTGVVIALATALGTLAVALGIGAIIQGVTMAFSLLGGAMALVTSPITLIIAGITALVAGFMYLWNTSEGFRNFWTGLWNSLVSIVTTVGSMLLTVIQTTWNTISTIISTVLNVIWTVVSTVWNAISTVISTVCNVIATVISTVWNTFTGIISGVCNAIMSVVSTVWNGISNVISTVMNVISSVISSVWNGISSVVSTVVNTIKSVITSVWNAIKSVTSSVWNAIKTAVSTPINAVKSVVSSAVNMVKSTVTSVWNAIKSTTTSVWNGIKSAIEGPINTAKNIVKSAIDAIKGFFNFQIKWPHIPLPHFSISGSLNPLDWLKGGLPKIGVEFYKKGAILNRATAFGMSPDGKVMVGGEAGAEAIAPISTLLDYVKQGVREVMTMQNADGQMIERQINTASRSAQMQSNEVSRLVELVGYYFPKLIDASQKAILLDGKELVGQTIDEIDSQLAMKYKLKARGI